MSDLRTGARFRRLGALVAAGVLATTLAACGSDDDGDSGSGSGGDSTEVALGYFPNLTHASAIVGINKGFFKDALAEDDATLKTLDFNSGSDVIAALQNGDLAASYIGPSPAITAYADSQNVTIVSGATSGGASLMVDKSITSPEGLKGKTIATPGPGNTQDVAAKEWLKQQGYNVSADGQGDVTVVNQDNSLTLQQFQQGSLDGAWVPEPYASQMEALGAVRLVNEKTLWPGGKFVTTQLLVNNDFLADHADLIDDLIAGQVQANDYIADNGDEAKQLTADEIVKITGGDPIPADALDQAWGELTFTNDPIADSLLGSAQNAVDVGLLESGDIEGLENIYSLDALNKQLAAAGEPEVKGPSA